MRIQLLGGQPQALAHNAALAARLGATVDTRVVMWGFDDRAGLDEALAAARREALSGFGDDRVFLERYVSRARHIEIQILGDAHGEVVHLGERECSVQRHFQKILEVAPAPALDAALRDAEAGEEALRAFLRERLAAYKVPKIIEFIDELPKSAVGKILRRKLKEMEEANLNAE